jgi:anti-anti-sigma factor
MVVDESLPSVPTLVLEGEWCISSLEFLRAPLDGLLQGGASSMVLDLRRVTFMDVATLHLMLDVRDRLAARGGRLVLVGVQGAVWRLLEAADQTRAFELEPGRREAARRLAPTAPRTS